MLHLQARQLYKEVVLIYMVKSNTHDDLINFTHIHKTTTWNTTIKNTTRLSVWIINKFLIQKYLLYRETKGHRTGAVVHQGNFN